MISVIIPVHNAEKFLSRCINSVLHNTYSDLEILLIENGSTDGSLELCRQYEAKYENISVYISDKTGVSHARNIGLDYAKGEYIAFVDADDYVSPVLYETMIKCSNENNADFIFCDFHQGSDKDYCFDVLRDKSEKCCLIPIREFYYELYVKDRRSYIAPWNKLIKREIVSHIRFDETLRVAEDRSFVARCVSRCNRLYKLEREMYYYYINSGSVCARSDKDSDIWLDMVRSLVKDYEFMLSEHSDQKIWKEYVNCCMLRTGDFHLKWAKRENNVEHIEYLNCIIRKSLKEIWKSNFLGLRLKFRVLAEHYFPGLVQNVYKYFHS